MSGFFGLVQPTQSAGEPNYSISGRWLLALSRSLYRLYERRWRRAYWRRRCHATSVSSWTVTAVTREEGGAYRASYQAGMFNFEEPLTWCAVLDIGAVTNWVLST